MPFTARSTPRRNLTFNERQFFSFLLAFVGVVYELGFAQILSATLGNTYLRYATTIGLFTLTLGVASLLYDRYRFNLRKLQAGLFIAGLLGPFLIMGADPSHLPDRFYWVAEGISYLPIIVVGLISGFELPLLMDEIPGGQKSFVLAFDYFGMFLGTLIFPLLMLPRLGVNGSLWACATLNALAFLYLAIPKRGGQA